mgnify:CR=1 FL=1
MNTLGFLIALVSIVVFLFMTGLILSALIDINRTLENIAKQNREYDG